MIFSGFFSALVFGFFGTFMACAVLLVVGRILQLWCVLPERTVMVYTFFGKVVGEVSEPGLFFPIISFGPKALLFPLFEIGRAHV